MTNTVRKLILVGPPQSEVPAGGLFIDIAQCLSIVNRKSYRQGMNYAISNMKFIAIEGGAIQVLSLPNNWCMDNATTKMFELWKSQRAEVLKESPSLKAKWSDFKVFMNKEHAAATVAANLTPVDPVTQVPYSLGEWQVSEITTPVDGGASGTAHQSTIHVVGDNVPAGGFIQGGTTSIGAIAEYSRSRALIQSPDPATPGAGTSLNVFNIQSSHDEMAVQILADTTYQNDEPPYDRDEYPGGSLQPYLELVDNSIVSNFGDTVIPSQANTGPFVPALGLINLQPQMLNNANIVVEIDLVPGKYKGVLAERGL